MKNKFSPLYFALLSLLFFSACDDNIVKNDDFKIREEANPSKKVLLKTVQTVKETSPSEYHFQFKNLQNKVNNLDVKNDIYNFKNIEQSIVIVNMMATWCPPCRGQLPHLVKLQKKFKEDIFVLSALVHDDIDKNKLAKLLIAQKVNYYVSTSQDENLKFIHMIGAKLKLPEEFPMPLTILFYKGKYFTHYEGMIPEEMIESDIKQLLKKIKR